MNSTQQLLAEIEAYLVRTGTSMTTFGRLAVGDKRLVARLRSGCSVTLVTADAIRLFMRTYDPARRTARGKAGTGRGNVPRASAA